MENTTSAENNTGNLELITPESLHQHIVDMMEHGNDNKGLFLVRTAAEWLQEAMNRPVPKMLFSEFWSEGELCILFADTNLGKSILAVQIADSISRGEPVKALKLEAAKQKVLYFDFELSAKQFEARYSVNFTRHYPFDNNFYRAEINPESADYETEGFKCFEDYLNHSIEQKLIDTDAKILIIDNITYLKDQTEKSQHALPLMKLLQDMKKKYGLSILALAHTPKRDLSKPLTKNDLQGSKMLINFCDTAFAIGESQTDKSIRYLKQIKARNTEVIYDTENVCVCQLTKDFNFLQFEFLNFGVEREHLKQQNDKDRDELKEKIMEMDRHGISQRDIAEELGISHIKVNRILKKECNKV